MAVWAWVDRTMVGRGGQLGDPSQLLLCSQLEGEELSLDIVAQLLEPVIKLGLCDAQLGVAGRTIPCGTATTKHHGALGCSGHRWRTAPRGDGLDTERRSMTRGDVPIMRSQGDLPRIWLTTASTAAAPSSSSGMEMVVSGGSR